MTAAIRQRKLFVAEDFRVIYRAFTEINFSSYDFDTLRSAMIDYIRINFPEDFNDWIESSEFVALIELLAYLGQSLAFRMDLNTRENFLDTAERRESILRLARLISFNPSRNFPATGLVKITEISTNEPIFDSNGDNLSNQSIVWNDPLNPDWFEQFILVMNSLLSATSQFGTPIKDGLIGGIKTQLYEMNNDTSANRIFPFSVTVGGESMTFDIVNPDFTVNEIFFEREPDPDDPRHIIFRNDGAGNGSENTGFFFLFKQGSLQKEDFQIDIPLENRIIDIAGTGINDIDVFVHEIDGNGIIIEKWIKVPTIIGNNIIFNSLEKNERNIFNVITELNDSINIRFADGRFGNVPTGLFRIWYRESNGLRYQIRPEEMRDIRLDIPYRDKVNNTLFFSSLAFSLQEQVANSSPTESSTQIQERAPLIYSTQDRMVNNEDYNVFPLRNSEAAKVKATNRIHSGFSRHIDINDPTGFSQNVNMFGEDGLLYLEENQSLEELALPTSLSDAQILNQIILPLVQALERRHFFYFNYDRYEPSTIITPISIARATGSTGGTFVDTETIFIDAVEITLSAGPGTGVTEAVASINTWPGLPAGILASNDNNRLQIENNITSFTLTEGSGTSLATLGLVADTYDPVLVNTFWKKATDAVNSSTGRLSTESLGVIELPIIVGDSVSGTNEFYIQEGSLLRFENAGLVSVVSIFDDGNTILANGDGAIRLAEDVDDGDELIEIFPPFRTLFNEIETNQILSQLAQKNVFGLRYDQTLLTWQIITGDNLAPDDEEFDFATAGNLTGLNVDTTWLVRAQFSPTNWRFISRGLDYIFESDTQIRFFHSESENLVDPQTGRTIQDFIKVLKINTAFELNPSPAPADVDFREIDPVESLNIDFIWNVEDVFVELDGFIDPRRIKVTFTDSDEDGIPDDPTFFEQITKITGSNIILELPDETPDETELFWETFTNTDGFEENRPTTVVVKAFNVFPAVNVDDFLFDVPPTPNPLYIPSVFDDTFTLEPLTLTDGDVIFFRDTKNFFRVQTGVDAFEDVTDLYFMRRGRNNFFFQWKHFANPDRRIDPAITNVIDMYVLTTSYDTLIRQWIDNDGTAIDIPVPPSSEELRILFAEETQNKMLSDEVIFHPVFYKLLFGPQAPEELQVRFKVTKVVGTEANDGEIKARTISAINEFFAINNWDFGEIFYYTELAAFIHQRLATVISSIVIVPLDEESKFGNLFQVRSEPNEVFISTAKVSDVQIVSAFSDDVLRIGN